MQLLLMAGHLLRCGHQLIVIPPLAVHKAACASASAPSTPARLPSAGATT